MPVEKSAAVFLDRDGTLVRDVGYLSRPDQIEIVPRGSEALKLLRQNGLKIVVVTNQSGVARGMLSEQELCNIHAAILESLALNGAKVDAIYYCPHHPTEGLGRYRVACACRKPNTGMVRQAARELRLDLGASYVIGDQVIDMELAARAGAKGVWIEGGSGFGQEAPPACRFVAADLWQAAEWVVGNLELDRRAEG